MSRSNPTDDTPHPSKRWFEWQGADGVVRYYDKEKKENVVVPLPFTFVVLDKLSVIKGWHEKSKSGITSNEVKDMRSDPFVVKAFKGGIIAEGFYNEIKDRIIVAGAHFTMNLYVAVHVDEMLQVASLQLKGKPLSQWMEFEKKNRGDIFKKAVRIIGSFEEQKGKIKYQVPIFELHELSKETNDKANELDSQLQKYLKGYFKRTKVEQIEPEPETNPVGPPENNGDADEIPF